VTVVLDVLLVALLAATIAAAYLLHRRLNALRADQGLLEALATRFADATARADDGIGRLKVSTETLDRRIAAAEALADDLRFLTEHANRAADRVEAGVRAQRDQPARHAAPSHDGDRYGRARGGEPAAAARRHSEAERALIRALGVKDRASEPAR
jgi:hypothetical protein